MTRSWILSTILALCLACGDDASDDALLDGGPDDAARDTGADDAGDAEAGLDAGLDAGPGDAGEDAGRDASEDADGLDTGADDAGADTGPPETAAPTVTLIFPPFPSLTDLDAITVRGTADDESEIQEVRVGSVLATSTDGFATWTARLPLSLGMNDLVISATDEWGNVAASAANVPRVERTTPMPVGLDTLAWDPDAQRAFSRDARSDVFEISATSGARRVIAHQEDAMSGLSYDAARDALLFVQGRWLVPCNRDF